MASPTLNVARYSALAFGVVYGWSHRRSLQSSHDAHKLEHAAHERERLIGEAKTAWKRQQEALINPNNGVITDPEDPRFDLEKLIAKWEATS